MAHFNQKKFEQVLHYIISCVGTRANVGKTVLYKMLYFSDFDYYELFEKSLTGEKYLKLPRGPAPSHFEDVLEILKDEGKVKVFKVPSGNFKRNKFISLSKPDISALNAEEIKLIDSTIDKLSNMNATQISDYSHQDMPWKAAEDKAELDYEQVFYRDDVMSVREYPEND